MKRICNICGQWDPDNYHMGERNHISNEPVYRISTDDGKTFEPLLNFRLKALLAAIVALGLLPQFY